LIRCANCAAQKGEPEGSVPAVNNMTKKAKQLNIKPIVSPEEAKTLKEFFTTHPELGNQAKADIVKEIINGEVSAYRPKEPWIQTYTGRRFNSTNPVPEAININDIAHALSMQCRFSGHVKSFYSVAQHCVLVSYICDRDDALAGLLHDASEAYLVDIPRPIKKSGKFDNYLEFEVRMEKAIAERFGVPDKMPESVRIADDLLLATEARDLMSPLHPSWVQVAEALPFSIKPMSQAEAKRAYLSRFYQLAPIPVKSEADESFEAYISQDDHYDEDNDP
jgi:uncharacterized protein